MLKDELIWAFGFLLMWFCVVFFIGLPVVITEDTCTPLTTYRALYPFTARNAEELSLEADCLIEVHE